MFGRDPMLGLQHLSLANSMVEHLRTEEDLASMFPQHNRDMEEAEEEAAEEEAEERVEAEERMEVEAIVEAEEQVAAPLIEVQPSSEVQHEMQERDTAN